MRAAVGLALAVGLAGCSVALELRLARQAPAEASPAPAGSSVGPVADRPPGAAGRELPAGPARSPIGTLLDAYRVTLAEACRDGSLTLEACDRHWSALAALGEGPPAAEAVARLEAIGPTLPALAALTRAIRALVAT